MFEYLMVEMDRGVVTRAGQSTGAAAAGLQDVVNYHANRGWEFYRVDTFYVKELAGCGCLMLFGSAPKEYTIYVVTFRRQAQRAAGPASAPPVAT